MLRSPLVHLEQRIIIVSYMGRTSVSKWASRVDESKVLFLRAEVVPDPLVGKTKSDVGRSHKRCQ